MFAELLRVVDIVGECLGLKKFVAKVKVVIALEVILDFDDVMLGHFMNLDHVSQVLDLGWCFG